MEKKDVFKRGVDVNDLVEIRDEMREAQKDDTPFPLVTQDGVKVIGDANATETKKYNYTVRFRFTKERAKSLGFTDDDILKTIGNYVIVSHTFEDVSIQARRDLELVSAIAHIYPYFYKLNEEKKLEERSDDELAKVAVEMAKDIGDDLYDLAASLLDLNEEFRDSMLWNDVIALCKRLPLDFPEVINETEGFIG